MGGGEIKRMDYTVNLGEGMETALNSVLAGLFQQTTCFPDVIRCPAVLSHMTLGFRRGDGGGVYT